MSSDHCYDSTSDARRHPPSEMVPYTPQHAVTTVLRDLIEVAGSGEPDAVAHTKEIIIKPALALARYLMILLIVITLTFAALLAKGSLAFTLFTEKFSELIVGLLTCAATILVGHLKRRVLRRARRRQQPTSDPHPGRRPDGSQPTPIA